MRLLVRNIGRIVGIEREGRLRLCGAEMDRMETLGDAWLLADGGRIAAFGRSGGEEGIAADRVVDAGGGMLFPSFCDSHTHLVYAGSREQEFLDKINGLSYEEIARRGGEIERPARPVTVYELELLDQTGPGDYTLRIRCSKGTYVRTLCHDIGQALGCGGCMSSLRRTVAAGFTLEEAVTLDRVQEEGEALLAPLDSLFRQHPAYRIRQPRVDALCRNGNPFTVRQKLPEGVYRVYGQSGEFLCLSRLEGGVMTSLKNFFGA